MMKISRRVISIFLIILAILLLVGGTGAYLGYRMVYAPNFTNEKVVYVYVDEKKDFDSLCRQLADSAGFIRPQTFQQLASLLKYPSNMRTGRYAVKPGTNNFDLLNDLRRGHQAVMRVTFNNVRFIDDLAKRVSEQLIFTQEDLLTVLHDSAYCASLGFNDETIRAMFIPNTYEIWWNTSAERFVERMKREYDAFWTPERRVKADAIGLSPVEVATLASIVEEETVVADELPVVAGLYINRLHRGMLLQADPTVKYAVGDFSLQRILFVHLEIESPYNTYIYAGLPPAPIRIPSIQGLNSVLNYTKHNYLYMVAKEDFSGRHNFSVTHAEHTRNANRYRAELNRRNIR